MRSNQAGTARCTCVHPPTDLSAKASPGAELHHCLPARPHAGSSSVGRCSATQPRGKHRRPGLKRTLLSVHSGPRAVRAAARLREIRQPIRSHEALLRPTATSDRRRPLLYSSVPASSRARQGDCAGTPRSSWQQTQGPQRLTLGRYALARRVKRGILPMLEGPLCATRIDARWGQSGAAVDASLAMICAAFSGKGNEHTLTHSAQRKESDRGRFRLRHSAAAQPRR